MRRLNRFVLITITLGVSACATVELEGSGSITPEAITASETVHGSLYGFRWKSFTAEKCGKDSLFRVETHTNVGLILASVLTLGVYVPQTIEWWCYSPLDDEEDEEVWDPSADEYSGSSR